MKNPWKAKSKVNPQAENGYRRIATDVLRALIRQRLTGGEWAVCMTVIDKTYGFEKLSDQISLTQFQQSTGLSRKGVIKSIQSLVNQRLLVVNHSTLVNEILFNKHYDTWVVNHSTLVNHSTPKLVNHSTPTIERKKEYIYSEENSVPRCPHQKIVALYHEMLPELRAVRIWSEDRRRILQARWKESKKRQSLDWWKEFFKYVKKSKFLMGEKTDFQADLEWLIRPKNFVKVVEGKYHS